ncbi:MAG TPA: DJ-1/PfpI family protein [Symbiobacteriaceae bacterium]|nr:DJ-1/PfpI family protein [Symbiobacteriaceae bacterium]
MAKVLFYIYPGFTEFEITVAMTILAHLHEVVTVGPDQAPVTGEGGLRCLPHVAIDQVNANDYAGLIVPGAEDAIHLNDAAALHELLRQMDAAGKPVAAVCSGPLALLRAGVLGDRPYTVAYTPEQRAFLQFPAETFQDVNVVRDGNLLTATGHGYAEFGVAVGDLFGIYRDAEHRSRVSRFYVDHER